MYEKIELSVAEHNAVWEEAMTTVLNGRVWRKWGYSITVQGRVSPNLPPRFRLDKPGNGSCGSDLFTTIMWSFFRDIEKRGIHQLCLLADSCNGGR